ncbi:MAG: DIP1984 family protein [Clostridia bacterium]
MKLAQALQLRADTQKRIDQLRERLQNNATVQEGELPAEDPKALFTQLDQCIAELEEWIKRINKTNIHTLIEDATLTDMIARRDCLTLKIKAYREFTESASQIASRAARTEIKILATLPVKEIQSEVDALARALRDTDMRIQQANWETDLL